MSNEFEKAVEKAVRKALECDNRCHLCNRHSCPSKPPELFDQSRARLGRYGGR